jgi:hypothetical protein
MLAAAIRKIAPTTVPETMAKNAAVQTLTALKKAMAPSSPSSEFSLSAQAPINCGIEKPAKRYF